MIPKIPQVILEHPAFYDCGREAAFELLDRADVEAGRYILMVEKSDKLEFPNWVCFFIKGHNVNYQQTIGVHYDESSEEFTFGNKTDLATMIETIGKFYRKKRYLNNQDNFLPYTAPQNENWSGRDDLNKVLSGYTRNSIMTKLGKKLQLIEAQIIQLSQMVEEEKSKRMKVKDHRL